MELPWLKSMIFWSILIIALLGIFQCTQRTENKKQASTSMYERLYQCAKELPTTQQGTLQNIQKQIQPNMTQQELMLLIASCRKAVPSQSTERYINAIRKLP